MVRITDCPASVVGPRPTTKAGFEAQQRRIQEWYDKAVAKEIEDHANRRDR